MRDRLIGWVVTESKEEAIKALKEMLRRMENCDDDISMVNMYVTRSELKEKA